MDRLLTLIQSKTMCHKLPLLSQFNPVNEEKLSNNKIFKSEVHDIELTLTNQVANSNFVSDSL